jgi:NADH-quinone oxidoreductase subunit C
VADATVVHCDQWHAELASAARAGFTYLDVLAAIDRGEAVELVVHLVDVASGDQRLLTTLVPTPQPSIDSVVDVFPGANWHEREAAELLGVRFVGHPDPRPLISRGEGAPLLLKATPLPARVETPWPGADDSASRRRGRTPGVLDTWVTDS